MGISSRCLSSRSAHLAFTWALLVPITWATTCIAGDGKPLSIGDLAPDFTLPTLKDEPVRLRTLLTKGPVVLVVLRGFPGYQCPLCNAQAGQFLGKAQKFADAKARLVFVYPGPSDALKEHAEEFIRGKTLPENAYLLLDPAYKFTSAYRLRWDAPNETAYPSTFVIGSDHKVVFAKVSKTHGDRASADDVLKSLAAGSKN
jgi:peroxiredoxin